MRLYIKDDTLRGVSIVFSTTLPMRSHTIWPQSLRAVHIKLPYTIAICTYLRDKQHCTTEFDALLLSPKYVDVRRKGRQAQEKQNRIWLWFGG